MGKNRARDITGLRSGRVTALAPRRRRAAAAASFGAAAVTAGGPSGQTAKPPFSPERLRRFRQLVGQASALAAELPADLSVRTEPDGRGYIDLSAPLFSVDESCSPQARQIFRTLLREADQLLLDGDRTASRLRLVFRLSQE